MKTALIIGSTGLVGSHLVQILLESKDYDKVVTFGKTASGMQHSKLTEHIIDFDKVDSYSELIKGDDFFCTIGTTIKKAGSKEAFRKVDFEYPMQFATIALKNGIKQFLLISSVGADPSSGNFYLRTKGEIELFLKNAGFESVSIVQPSLLLGDRKEFRFGEKLGAVFMKAFSFLFIGGLKKYKPIQASIVAKALYVIAQKNIFGFQIYKSDALQKLGN
ncbi:MULTISPECIES: NAD(P)H-binding protein [unclassified Flavobacterium]|uniref:NAD(P)H-binding protein n=1 Tax=unclassified Flavobacterium TaxID=196869 RepID=UPI003F939D7E